MRGLTCAVILGVLLFGGLEAQGATITLDFDTPGTGSNILVSPLVTAEGTITASALGGSLGFFPLSDFPTTSLTHDQSDDTDLGQLAFSFDVSSVTFNFSGFGSGAFSAQVLDSGLNVLDSFFDPDTSNDHPGGPISLSGSGVRFFTWGDTPSTFVSATVDNLQIATTPSPVPEPTSVVLVTGGLMGIGVRQWRKRRGR